MSYFLVWIYSRRGAVHLKILMIGSYTTICYGLQHNCYFELKTLLLFVFDERGHKKRSRADANVSTFSICAWRIILNSDNSYRNKYSTFNSKPMSIDVNFYIRIIVLVFFISNLIWTRNSKIGNIILGTQPATEVPEHLGN